MEFGVPFFRMSGRKKSGAAYFRRKASSVARPVESESRRTTVLANTARDGALTIDNGRIQSTNPAVRILIWSRSSHPISEFA